MSTVSYPKGYVINAISAGIKEKDKLDLGLIYSKSKCHYTALFTKNNIQASPVKVCKERLKEDIQAVVVNSKNANSFTGKQGLADAYCMTEIVENELALDNGSCIPLSTGVIGEPLPMGIIKSGIQQLCKIIRSGDSKPNQFARSILTTDTFVKEMSKVISIDDKNVTIYGTAKGSGMIFPNMATMLAFIVSDVAITKPLLEKALSEVNEETFNSISVDGDMSTNDTVLLLANSEAKNSIIDQEDEKYTLFKDALKEIALYLSQAIVRDGEGATKFIKITVIGAVSLKDARGCAFHLANSLLVKTAFFGEDANWGRFVYGVGASGCKVEESQLDITLGDIILVKQGQRTDFTDDQASLYMKNSDLYLEINLNLGTYSKTVYTTDLSYEYIKINAEYRS